MAGLKCEARLRTGCPGHLRLEASFSEEDVDGRDVLCEDALRAFAVKTRFALLPSHDDI
jgi:hypothetical protein